MFIVVLFGYRSRKLFTIDCLAAAVFNYIWQSCYKELSDTYLAKDTLFIKESQTHSTKIQANQKKLQDLKSKQQEDPSTDKKKQDKKTAKKGGKDAPTLSPLQQQRLDLEKAIEFSRTAITKYTDKRNKLKDLRQKLQDLRTRVLKESVYVELVDKTGQRKYIKTKLEQEASAFLSDKGTYYLCTVSANGEEEEVEALTHEGYSVSTVEEDTTNGNQEVFTVKKDDKGKKGGKKK